MHRVFCYRQSNKQFAGFQPLLELNCFPLHQELRTFCWAYRKEINIQFLLPENKEEQTLEERFSMYGLILLELVVGSYSLQTVDLLSFQHLHHSIFVVLLLVIATLF